jgi:hypothetical protein
MSATKTIEIYADTRGPGKCKGCGAKPRTPLEQLTEAVRRFQSATHSFGCHCDACHRLNAAVAAALTSPPQEHDA